MTRHFVTPTEYVFSVRMPILTQIVAILYLGLVAVIVKMKKITSLHSLLLKTWVQKKWVSKSYTFEVQKVS